MTKSISLILPMFNEKEYLPKTIDRAIAVLEKLSSDYEIIIVDDASTDGCGLVGDELSKSNSHIKIFHHLRNRKLGGVLKTGFSNAIKDIVIYTDMDLPFDLEKLLDIFPLTDDYDIVLGSRIGKREFFLRTVYSSVYNWLIRFIFGLNLKDINFALKIFHRKILQEIDLKSEGSFINAELLAKALRYGYTIKEVDVQYNIRTYGISRLSHPGVIAKILFELVKFYPEIKLFSRKRVLFKQIEKLYNGIGFFPKIYNFIRFRTCPFELIEKFIPTTGHIVDLGCGSGIFLNLLSLGPRATTLSGFDFDSRKIEIAKLSVRGRSNISFTKADNNSKDFKIPKANCIVIIDVLGYLDPGHVREFLNKCYEALDLDGCIVIKDIRRSLSLKFLWLYLQDFIVVRICRFTASKSFHFKEDNYYVSLLNNIGFEVKVFDLSKGYLYPHSLYVGEK